MTSGLPGRMVLDVKSLSRLRKARNCFPKWAPEEPHNAAFQMLLAEIGVRLRVFGQKEPAAVMNSTRVREVVDELALPRTNAGISLRLRFSSRLTVTRLDPGLAAFACVTSKDGNIGKDQ